MLSVLRAWVWAVYVRERGIRGSHHLREPASCGAVSCDHFPHGKANPSVGWEPYRPGPESRLATCSLCEFERVAYPGQTSTSSFVPPAAPPRSASAGPSWRSDLEVQYLKGNRTRHRVHNLSGGCLPYPVMLETCLSPEPRSHKRAPSGTLLQEVRADRPQGSFSAAVISAVPEQVTRCI